MALSDYLKHIPGIRTGTLLTALSGGADSVALLHVLHKMGCTVHAAHVNYGLRGKESQEDEAFCRELCRQLNVPIHVYKADPLTKNGNTQQWARDIRYRFFEELDLSLQFSYIFTAHQANDAFESLLMNTADGCGPSGFLGIPSRNGKYLRPFLHCTRREIEAYCHTEGLNYRNDSSNNKDIYKRNRVRKEIAPLYEDLNPQAMQHFARSRERLEHVLAFYHTAYRDFCGKELQYQAQTEKLTLKPEYKLFYAEWLAEKGFASGLAADILSGHYERGEWHSRLGRLLLHGGQLIFSPGRYDPAEIRFPVEGPGSYVYEKYRVEVAFCNPEEAPDFSDPGVFYADAEQLNFPLLLRSAGRGDTMQPLGMNGRKKLSDILTDKKVNRFDKEKALVLCSGDEIVWLYRYATSEKTKISAASTRILKVQISEM